MIKTGIYKEYVTCEVKVNPKSRKNEIDLRDSKFYIKVTSAPEKGKANKAVIDLLSKKLDIRKSDLIILKGETVQNKLIGIKISRENLIKKIKNM
ncbi:MAG: DUF167 domain-containing protein [Armatimonadota bacterium]